MHPCRYENINIIINKKRNYETITAFVVTLVSLAACQKQTQFFPAAETPNPVALQAVKQGDEGVDFRQSNKHV